MTIVNFTPWSALIGGALIGLSAALLWWLDGRIAGVSGILHTLLEFRPGHVTWRLLFLGGLLVGTGLWLGLTPPAFAARQGFSLPLLAGAGFLVGAGTMAAGGCTSGHGVCGLGQLSLRSLVAVLTFMGTAGITVYVARHVMGAI
jgi:uncharacterized membrane protein YedE/YeeE